MKPSAAVIGAGISGLVTAYRLTELGFRVTIFEQHGVAGGLASSVVVGGTHVDRYFHFICPPDAAYLTLIDELGLSSRLKWRATRMGVFFNGVYHRFGTPASLLAFSPLSVSDRVRFGLAALRSRARTEWRDLDALSAKEWLVAEQGVRCYDAVWRPLLEQKFGDAADEVSAAWMWARINRAALSRSGPLMRERLGYLEGGTKRLVDELVARVSDSGGRFEFSTEISAVTARAGRVSGVVANGEGREFDVVVSTIPPAPLAGMTDGLPEPYSTELGQIEYYGIACWVLVAREPLCDDFWLNVHDSRVPFPGVITYTQLDPKPELGGAHVHYVPLYMSADDPRASINHDSGLAAVLQALDYIRPGFSELVTASFLFGDPDAQPVYVAGFQAAFGETIAPRTPLPGLYRADMSQVYPNDRSVVNAIDFATRAVAAILADSNAGESR